MSEPALTPYYDQDGITIYHADCREVLSTLDTDVLVTDPPFNIGKDYGTTNDDLSPEDYEALLGLCVAKGPERQGWFSPKQHWLLLGQLLGPDARPVIVKRGAVGPLRWGWKDQFDILMVRGKPRRPERNLWEDIRLKGEGYFFREDTFDHPGYTPRPIFARLIDLLAEPGEVILDPFAGTGTSLVAAKAAGHRAIGIEIEERYCEIAVQRLAQGVLPLCKTTRANPHHSDR